MMNVNGNKEATGEDNGHEQDGWNINQKQSSLKAIEINKEDKRIVLSLDINENICVLNSIIRAHTASQLYLLSLPPTLTPTLTPISNFESSKYSDKDLYSSGSNSSESGFEFDISTEVRLAISGAMKANIHSLEGVWEGIAIDAARFVL